MEQSGGGAERPVRAVGGTALLLRHGDALGRYAVHGLSVAGASLVGVRPVERGRTVRVLFELPNGPGPVACRGAVSRVARRARGGVGLELRFPHLAPETEDLLQDAVVAALTGHQHGRRAIVFDPRRDARARLEGAARIAGYRVATARTPLEALMAVRAEAGRAALLLVDGAGLDRSSLEAVELLAHRPEVSIVGVESRDRRRFRVRARLAEIARRMVPADLDVGVLASALVL